MQTDIAMVFYDSNKDIIDALSRESGKEVPPILNKNKPDEWKGYHWKWFLKYEI